MAIGSHKRACITRALTAAKGNINETRRLLMKQLETDDLLFRELAAPFMHGIVSHAIESVAKADGIETTHVAEGRSAAKATAPARQLDAGQLDQVLSQFGHAGAPAAASSGSGQEAAEYNPAKQANTMRALADLYKKRRMTDYYD